ncbi:chitinase [Fomitiporia mediterranea MF3/22]|uniref:chitinase n=1 Tax=Fomitiporia mediterranea (strain MF3/22) TaxID=694068 RepID=UPI0004407F03|nr:chitinase [Fomitiporia mediterranea MF3/22]EJC98494.1 chitinase [Fomitiporia mediterranea MF3/22]
MENRPARCLHSRFKMLVKSLASSVALLSSLCFVAGAPQASSGAKFVIYSDKTVANVLPDVSQIEGYNVFALSFLLSTGAADQAKGWQSLDAGKRKDLKSAYNKAGIKLMVSAFGATEQPTTSGVDATKTANDMANWVKQYDVDGIDVDYEDLTAMNAGDGKAEAWLATFTKTLRGQLPQGKYIITHAPLPPWFNSETYKGGGYVKVNKEVGNMIDWYNLQFYNDNDYTDCNSLLTSSKTKTSLFEIAKTGVDQNKLVLGKPATSADASNGFMDTKTLAGCVKQAKGKGWEGGVMVWQYPNANSQWIKDVRGDAFPTK